MGKEEWIATPLCDVSLFAPCLRGQHLFKACFFRVGLLGHRTVLGSVLWEFDASDRDTFVCSISLCVVFRDCALGTVPLRNVHLGRCTGGCALGECALEECALGNVHLRMGT